MLAGKCCCASTPVFAVASGEAEHASLCGGGGGGTEAHQHRDNRAEQPPEQQTDGPVPTDTRLFRWVRKKQRGAGGGPLAGTHENEPRDNMNGAVYISFFQGQLETVLEQVVQLAVQEISKTVGSSLNALLLETAVKEQENRRLRLQLLSSAEETRGRHDDSSPADGGTSAAEAAAAAGKKKAGKVSGDERPKSGRTLHAPRGLSSEPGGLVDTRRLEQRGRVVDQLKSVMQQVLDFAVCELTKIVEASFDDLLLEITKMEKEHQVLEERLGNGFATRGGGGGVGGRRRGSEKDSMSLSGSEDAKEDLGDVAVSKEKAVASDPARPPVLSVSQDWVPILDKVFGQQWCSDVWQIKDVGGGGGGGRGLSEAGVQQMQPHPDVSVALEPSSPQHDPRWTPLEDMEVLSPDDDPDQRNPGNRASTAIGRPSPAPPLSPSRSSSRRSSASMLQRLLTLPSQLLEDNDAAATASEETLATVATDDSREQGECPLPPTVKEEEEDEEEVEEEEGDEEGEKGRKKKRRRMWSECDECGRRFSRVLLLKAHRQTHAAADATSPSSPPSSTSSLQCSECGKRFSSVTRLHSHTRTQHPGIQS